MSTRSIALFLLISFIVLPASGERPLSIEGVSLNGFNGRDIRVRAGERIYGSVTTSTISNSIFRTHTGVWLPSWDKTPGAMRVYLSSSGGASSATANIDLYAPNVPGVYYILFCFDRKGANEMFTEITLRSDEQTFANGDAIRVMVEGGVSSLFAPLAPSPASSLSTADLSSAKPLDVNGIQYAGSAGYGFGGESLWRLTSSNLSSNRDDAVRVRMLGDRPNVDLDLEVVDQYGRRRGLSERDGSYEEVCVVRVRPEDVLYVRVFGFKRGEQAAFRISADRASLFTSRRDPSFGRAQSVSDGFTATDRAGLQSVNPRWYAVTLTSDGSVSADLRGAELAKDLDLWIYDDLGNLRQAGRTQGTSSERVSLDYAEAGTYYIKVGAVQSWDESNYSISIRALSSGVSSPYQANDPYKDRENPLRGVEFNLGGIRFRLP